MVWLAIAPLGALASLEMMDERGRDVGCGESFFQQSSDQMILLLEFTAGQRGPQLVEKRAGAGLFHFVERCIFQNNKV